MFGCGKNFLFALFVFIGTTVGAGMFGLPYVVAKSGVIPALFYFLVLGAAMALIHLFFGESILRTKEDCRLIGLGRKYLGKRLATLLAFSVFVGLSGSLLVYIILGGDFLSIMVSGFLPIDPFYCSLIFGAVFIPIILRGIKVIAPLEIFTNILFFLIIFLIVFIGFPKISLDNFDVINIPNFLLPYGIILFSLVGLSALPEIKEMLKTQEEKKSFKKVLVAGFLFIILFYIFFAFSVVGISGNQTSTDIFRGLIPFLGPQIIFFGALAAFITISDSFLIIALYLKNTLVLDYRVPRVWANVITAGIPLGLFLLGLREFVEVIGFLGTIIGVIDGIAIILIFKKAKSLGNREPEYSLKVPSAILITLAIIFVIGAIAQFLI